MAIESFDKKKMGICIDLALVALESLSHVVSRRLVYTRERYLKPLKAIYTPLNPSITLIIIAAFECLETFLKERVK